MVEHQSIALAIVLIVPWVYRMLHHRSIEHWWYIHYYLHHRSHWYQWEDNGQPHPQYSRNTMVYSRNGNCSYRSPYESYHLVRFLSNELPVKHHHKYCCCMELQHRWSQGKVIRRYSFSKIESIQLITSVLQRVYLYSLEIDTAHLDDLQKPLPNNDEWRIRIRSMIRQFSKWKGSIFSSSKNKTSQSSG